MKRLYQKHHGLPGIPQTSGRNGKDGDGGNNIYINPKYIYLSNDILINFIGEV